MTTTTYASLDEIEQRRKAIDDEIELRFNAITAMTDLAQTEYRDLTEAETAKAQAEATKLAGLRADLEVLEERQRTLEIATRSRQIADAIGQATGRRPDRGGHSTLLVSEAHLRRHADAIRDGSVFGAEEAELHTRATVTVATDMGSARDWGSNTPAEPVTLRRFAGIPNSGLTGMTAQMPSVTLPAGAAGVNESTAHGEFDAVDVANLSALRYGRWSNVTPAVDAFDDLRVINRAHAVGVARDLNLLDVTAIQTAAGSVTAFSASLLDQNVRAAILKVAAAALVDPEDVVLFGTSAALAVVNGYAPTSGGDRGSVTTRVFGARVYVTESAAAGNVYAFAPPAFLTFSDGLRSASTIAPDTGQHKFGSWLHSTAPGVAIVGGAAGVDVVTP
jgi:hypothetical protein